MMSGSELSINEYLFHEFGMDEDFDESRISANWPFTLRLLGQLGERIVYEFDDDEPFYAFTGGSLSYLPKAGMDLADLVLQFDGARWINSRGPVTLADSLLSDSSVPSGIERRRALHQLATDHLGGPVVQILEGLFLREPRQYISLAGLPGRVDATVVGLPRLITVGFTAASARRRLSWGVGKWLQSVAEPDNPAMQPTGPAGG